MTEPIEEETQEYKRLYRDVMREVIQIHEISEDDKTK